jgi:hypothetical protein
MGVGEEQARVNEARPEHPPLAHKPGTSAAPGLRALPPHGAREQVVRWQLHRQVLQHMGRWVMQGVLSAAGTHAERTVVTWASDTVEAGLSTGQQHMCPAKLRHHTENVHVRFWSHAWNTHMTGMTSPTCLHASLASALPASSTSTGQAPGLGHSAQRTMSELKNTLVPVGVAGRPCSSALLPRRPDSTRRIGRSAPSGMLAVLRAFRQSGLRVGIVDIRGAADHTFTVGASICHNDELACHREWQQPARLGTAAQGVPVTPAPAGVAQVSWKAVHAPRAAGVCSNDVQQCSRCDSAGIQKGNR